MRPSIVTLFITGYLVSFGHSQATAKCSASSPCAQGCCNNNQVCGFGPAFCAPSVCTPGASVNGTCGQKSECDPGVYPGYGDIWGPDYAAMTTCPLHVCCSPYGFCGTTSKFCGNATAVSQSKCSKPNSSSNRTVGYWDASNSVRPCDTMLPENIPIESYTHINFAFASIDPTTYNVTPMAPDQLSLYTRFTGLKKKQPGLKTWISIGGWNFTDPGPTQNTFSQLAASQPAKTGFYASLIGFMKQYDFDGVDIYWEYPGVLVRGGSVTDFSDYVAFLEGLKSALGVAGDFGFSISIPSSYSSLQNFDIVTIAQVADWINVMTYDLHGTWDKNETSVGPFVYADTNLTEIMSDMDLLWRNNIDPAKLNLGIGLYGRGYTLSNNDCTAPGCPFSGGSYPGPCTLTSGLLSYDEIVSYIQNSGGNVTLDPNAAVQIATWDSNQWIAYDSPQTLQMKLDYANGRCIGGTAVWTIDLDVEGSLSHALSNTTAANGAQSSSALNTPSMTPTNIPVNPMSTRVYPLTNSTALGRVVSDVGTAGTGSGNVPTGTGSASGTMPPVTGTNTPLNPTSTRVYWMGNSTGVAIGNTVATTAASVNTYSVLSGILGDSSTSYYATFTQTVLLPTGIPAYVYASSGYAGPTGSTMPAISATLSPSVSQSTFSSSGSVTPF